MKKYVIVFMLAIAAIAAVLVMQARSPQKIQPTDTAGSPPHGEAGAASGLAYSGKVLETMNAGGYTYVHVESGDKKIWAAGPETAVETGSVVSFPPGMQMTDFRSEELNRTFEVIYFVPEIRTGEDVSRLSAEHLRPGSPAADAGDMDLSGIEVPAGGQSIAALHGEKRSLAGKEVIVRGKVVKFTANVMQKNWVHLRDGTGTGETADVTLTTSAVVALGDIVLVKGRLVVDQDFGSGYTYAILIEDAEVTVESTASIQ